MLLHSLVRLGRPPKRRGRGVGSRGAKSGRGMKGQGSRAGSFVKAGFEGGQTPLYMRLPKGRGTKQKFSSQVIKPAAVAVRHLEVFAPNSMVGPAQLAAHGLIGRRARSVKIIGGGKIDRKLTVRAQAVTPGARTAIEEAGGKVEIIF